MTPINFLASAITKLADDASHFGKVYNVVQQGPVPADHVFAHMESLGYVSERVPIGEWKARLEDKADRDEDMESKILVRSLESVVPYLADSSVYDISQFVEALSEVGLTMPAVDADYVASFLRK